jgi:hypothetical protein
MNGEFNNIKTDLAVIKTVLVMKGIMPNGLAKGAQNDNQRK